MDLFDAVQGRRSCRKFSGQAVEGGAITQILEAGLWAPSPLNAQPWEFVVITTATVKESIQAEAERCRAWAIQASGWKWLEAYDTEFLKQAPVIIAVIADSQKSGVDMFQEEGGVGYQHACAAAIQNMLLAAHALGLGSLWFTFFDKDPMRVILEIPPAKIPLALICLGRPAGDIKPVPRKGLEKKVRYL